MAHGLEVRAPFLDRDLVEYAFSLPRHYKLRGTSLKRILRHAARDLLPREIIDRRKRGFGVPLDRWFRTELRTLVASRLGAPDARVREHLDGGALDGLLAEHAGGRVNHGHAIWTLLTLELFLRREEW
jgi:asparagine synthase (glutamine-hydrolysing)